MLSAVSADKGTDPVPGPHPQESTPNHLPQAPHLEMGVGLEHMTSGRHNSVLPRGSSFCH